MREEIVESYRGYGVKPENIKSTVAQAFETLETPRKVLVSLEIEHRKKLIAQEAKCTRCPRTDMLTIDHVIPKAILAVMGIDVDRTFIPENLMLLCRPCNSIKSDRLDFSIPRTKELLTRLLARL